MGVTTLDWHRLASPTIMAAMLSRYVRTTVYLRPLKKLPILENASIGVLSAEEVAIMAERARRGHLFSRLHWQNSFYVERIQALAERAVIDILLPGEPDEILRAATNLADSIEDSLLLSSGLVLERGRFQRLLGLKESNDSVFDFAVSDNYKYMRTRSNRALGTTGLPVDDRFVNRFARYHARDLLVAMTNDQAPLANRLRRSAEWLLQSRREVNPSSATVKTAIALEAMLVFANTEPLTQSLSDRSAFLLTDDPETRQMVSSFIRRFYDARWREWFDSQRWGAPTSDILRPFSVSQVRRALSLATKSPG